MITWIFFAVFLDGDVGQMDEHVVDFGHVWRVQLVAKPSEAFVEHPGFERAVRSDETIHSEIEFFAADEHGVIDVTGNDPDVVGLKVFEGGVEVGTGDDFFELVDFFKQENALTLGFIVGFDDPGGIGIFLEFFKKYGVLIWVRREVLGKMKVCGKNSMWRLGPPQI